MLDFNALAYLLDKEYLTAVDIARRYDVCMATAYNYLAALAPDQVRYTIDPDTHRRQRAGLSSAIHRLIMTTRPGNPKCTDSVYQRYVANCRWYGRQKEPFEKS